MASVLAQIKEKFWAWRMERMRAAALKYINLLNVTMINQGSPRYVRKRFFKELIDKAKFYQGEEEAKK